VTGPNNANEGGGPPNNNQNLL